MQSAPYLQQSAMEMDDGASAFEFPAISSLQECLNRVFEFLDAPSTAAAEVRKGAGWLPRALSRRSHRGGWALWGKDENLFCLRPLPPPPHNHPRPLLAGGLLRLACMHEGAPAQCVDSALRPAVAVLGYTPHPPLL